VFYLLAYGLMNVLAFASLPAGPDDLRRDRLDGCAAVPAPAARGRVAGDRAAVTGRDSTVPGVRREVPDFQERRRGRLHASAAVLGLVGSYLGIYFYLRVIQLMFMGERPDVPSDGRIAIGAGVLCPCRRYC
jgi:NADH-quinone oxidoreductase subunit N